MTAMDSYPGSRRTDKPATGSPDSSGHLGQ
jgi:hypothetical protein